jgi:pilus assembly protein CpaB
VPGGAARDPDEIVGRTVLERILPGEPIRLERLTAKDVQPGLAALVGKGSRAVSLDVSDSDRVSGFIDPGATVDVIVTFPKERDIPAETVTMGQNLRVLAVDEILSETAQGEEPVTKEQVTLAMNPVDAERILHAVKVGEPRLTLRSYIDHEVTPLPTTRSTSRIGRVSVSIGEWWEAFTPEAFAAMQARLERARLPEPLPIDASLLRPLHTP